MLTARRLVLTAGIITLATALTLLLAPGASAGHKTFTVDSTGDAHDDVPGDGDCKTQEFFLVPPFGSGVIGGDCTLRAAVEEANAHLGRDTIKLPADTILLSLGSLDITESVTIQGTAHSGQPVSWIDGKNNQTAPLLYDGIQLTGNRIEISDVGITGFATVGPPLQVLNGQLDTRNVQIQLNNSGSSCGGGLFVGDSAVLVFTAGKIQDNQAGQGGGICVGPGGTVSVSDSSILRNRSQRSGGGVYCWPTGSVELNGTTVSENLAENGPGGGIDAPCGVTVTSSVVHLNVAFGHGGGIASNLAVLLSDSTVSDNEAKDAGGGLYLTHSSLISRSRVLNNIAANGGGGVDFADGVAFPPHQIIESEVSSNRGGACGGVRIGNYPGDVVIDRVTIASNEQSGAGGAIPRGGICTGGALIDVRNSTVSDNIGIGISAIGGSVRSSTISGNSATAFNVSLTLSLSNVTIAGNGRAWSINTATNGMVELQGVLIGLNGPQSCDPGDAIVSLGYNFDADGSCGLAAPNDLSGVDPLLGPLANNGGPTQTHALLQGSPAIHAGNPGAPPTDQRGLPRVGLPDIGAFEFQEADGDGDGIADDIDVTTGVPSDAFDDGAGTAGTITDRGGLTVIVTDQPGNGVIIQVSGGAGTATVIVCGGFPLTFTAGDAATISCGSVTITVTAGSVELPLADGVIVVSIDNGGSATVTDNGDGTYTVSSAADSVGDVTVTTDETEAVLAPGDGDTFRFAVPTATISLLGGFNAVVFPGADGTSVEEVATLIGPALDAIFLFDAATQTWLVHRPDVAVPALNTLTGVNQRDVLFVLIPSATSNVVLSWPDALVAAPVTVALEPGFTFVGYTGADDVRPVAFVGENQSVDALFVFDALTQRWEGFFPGQPAFLNALAVIDRGDAVFVHTVGTVPPPIDWEQVAFTPEPESPGTGDEGIDVVIEG